MPDLRLAGGRRHEPGVTTITAGSLADPSVFRPQFVVYTSRGHAWDHVDPAVPSFPKLPPMPTGNQQQERRG